MLRPALTALALLSAPAAAQTLEGSWLGFAATAILQGITVPLVEELVVQGDQAQQRGWTLAIGRDCTGAPDQPPACAGAIDLGSVGLVLQGDRLAVRPEGPQTNPYAHPIDHGYWPQTALAGHDWRVRLHADHAILSREAVIEGEPFTLERIYLRAPAGAGGWLFDYLMAMDLSVARGLCALQALHTDPEGWPAFMAHLQAVAPVTGDVAQIWRLPRRTRAVALREMTLMRGAEEMGENAGFVADIPEAARQAWLDHRAWVRDGAEPPAGQVTMADLAFPVAPETAERAAACLEYFDY